MSAAFRFRGQILTEGVWSPAGEYVMPGGTFLGVRPMPVLAESGEVTGLVRDLVRIGKRLYASGVVWDVEPGQPVPVVPVVDSTRLSKRVGGVSKRVTVEACRVRALQVHPAGVRQGTVLVLSAPVFGEADDGWDDDE